MSGDRTGVLYVGGWGRSGSTLLSLLLGQLPGLAAVGEVREIWQKGLIENGACGCGEAFRSCAFWTQVGEKAFAGWDRLDVEATASARYTLDRGWMTPLLWAPGGPVAHQHLLPAYLDTLGRLYRAIAEVTGARWIVDSSKLPSHALLLRRLGSLDVRLLHLIRDSRAVAASWQKRLESAPGSGREFLRYGPVSSALRYDFYNSATSAIGRRGPYLRLRYEDAIEDVRSALVRICRFIGEGSEDPLTFVEPTRAHVAPTHTIEGNPMRFASGTIELRADEAWRSQLPTRDRRIVTALTYPWLSAYGYRPGR
jgi:Sulfotransferase family